MKAPSNPACAPASADASALDAAVGSWLGARLRAADQGHGLRQRRALAVDGKAVRGTRHSSSDGQAVHLLGVIDQQARAVLAQAAVDGKTNEITQFAPLLEDLDITGAVITADALHTQRQHAKFLVSDKKAHYILVVKKNQPTLYAQVKNLPWRYIPAGCKQRDRGHGREEHRTLKAAAVTTGHDLDRDALAARAVGQVQQLVMHDSRRADEPVQHRFIDDHPQLRRRRPVEDALALDASVDELL